MLISLSTACQGVCSLYPAAIVQVNVMRSETVQVATKTDPKLSLQLVIVLSFSVIVLIRAWTRRKHAELCASGCGHTVVDVVPLQLSGSSKPAAPNRVARDILKMLQLRIDQYRRVTTLKGVVPEAE